MPVSRTIRLVLVLAIAPAAAVGIAAAQPAPSAPARQAPSGTLTFGTAAPAPGARVEVRYRAAARFAAAPRLVLRARLRTPGDQDAYLGGLGAETRRITTLVPGGDGVLRGSFVWPDSVVYALFAVETPDGRAVDTHGNQGWELLARTAAGHPTADALDQRARDLTQRNPLAGLAAAREGARLYPDAPESWLRLWWFEGYAQGKRVSDATLLPVRRARLEELTRAMDAKPSPTGSELGAMMNLARGLKHEAAPAWEARLLRHHPRHRDAVPVRIRAAMAEAGGAEARLQALERLWSELGATDDYLLMVGAESALNDGDPADVLRWAGRLLAHVPFVEAQTRLAQALAERPATRAEGMQHIRALLARLGEARDADRDLFRSTILQRDRDEENQAQLLAALGKALQGSGAGGAARDTLARAASRSASPALLRQIADAQLTAGDTAGAVRTWVRVAPGAGGEFVDTVRERAGRHFQARRWAADVAAARAELGARVRRAEVRRPSGLRLAEGGRATVVVFGKSTCGFSVRSLPELQRMADALGRLGVRTVLVTDEAPTPELQRFFAERGFTGPVRYDPSRSTHAAFGSAGTPEYFVVDAAGTIRFEYSSLEELPGQVAALN